MVGGGQLARMTHQAAIDLGIDLVVLVRHTDEPAAQAGARAILGAPDDGEALLRLAREVDVVTFDHEHVPAHLSRRLSEMGHCVRPQADALLFAQDKLHARRGFAAAGFPVPPFSALGPDPVAEGKAFAAEHGWPIVLKTRRGGYDGRGVAVVEDAEHLEDAVAAMGQGGLLVEGFVELVQELAVVGARSPSGAWVAYPLVATLQVNGICNELVMPATVDAAVARQAEALARSIAERIDATGILAVELFLTNGGDLIVNEIALRPHNSGHATIEGCATSQFHNHLRAVLDWPLGDTALRAPAAAMVNLLGPEDGSDPASRLPAALSIGGASFHLYGKAPAPGRKLGHVTVLGPDQNEALAAARRAATIVQGVPAAHLS
jgi:5-(carboxyamino)imidazole ribonucleotide synthase